MMPILMLAVLMLSLMAAPARAERMWNSCFALMAFLQKDGKFQNMEKIAGYVERCNELPGFCERTRDMLQQAGVPDPGFACKERPVQAQPE